ncbi:MAG: hypothetical protein ACK4OM_05250 [Alphaproteobacteria bacterium]
MSKNKSSTQPQNIDQLYVREIFKGKLNLPNLKLNDIYAEWQKVTTVKDVASTDANYNKIIEEFLRDTKLRKDNIKIDFKNTRKKIDKIKNKEKFGEAYADFLKDERDAESTWLQFNTNVLRNILKLQKSELHLELSDESKVLISKFIIDNNLKEADLGFSILDSYHLLNKRYKEKFKKKYYEPEFKKELDDSELPELIKDQEDLNSISRFYQTQTRGKTENEISLITQLTQEKITDYVDSAILRNQKNELKLILENVKPVLLNPIQLLKLSDKAKAKNLNAMADMLQDASMEFNTKKFVNEITSRTSVKHPVASFEKINNYYKNASKLLKGNFDKETEFCTEEVSKVLNAVIAKADMALVKHILKSIHPDIFPHESKIEALNLAAKNGSLDIADLILNNSRSLVKPSLIADKELNMEARMLLITKGADPKDLKPIKGKLSKEEISKLKEFKKEVDKFEKGLYREDKLQALVEISGIVEQVETMLFSSLGKIKVKDFEVASLKSDLMKDKDLSKDFKNYSDKAVDLFIKIAVKKHNKEITPRNMLEKMVDLVNENFKSLKDLFQDSKGKKEITVAKKSIIDGASKEDKKAFDEALGKMLKTGMKKAERDETVKETFKSKLEEKSASKTVNPGRKK